MRRLLAVLGAAAMVIAAVAVRRAIDDPDGTTTDPGGDGEVTVVCDPDLEAYCRALPGEVDVRVEDSATTAQAIVAGDAAGIDAWFTSAAWLDVVESRADRSLEAEALASTPVVVAVDAERADAVDDLCRGERAWRCLGDDAGVEWESLGGDPRWGQLKTGLADGDTAVGLAVLASVASGFFDSTDFAANDFGTGDFTGWLDQLASASRGGDRDVLRSLVRVRGTYSAGGVLGADADGHPEISVTDAEPTVDAVAVAVALPGGGDVDADPVRAAMVDEGWDAAEGEPAPTLKPGVAAALHTLWEELTS